MEVPFCGTNVSEGELTFTCERLKCLWRPCYNCVWKTVKWWKTYFWQRKNISCHLMQFLTACRRHGEFRESSFGSFYIFTYMISVKKTCVCCASLQNGVGWNMWIRFWSIVYVFILLHAVNVLTWKYCQFVPAKNSGEQSESHIGTFSTTTLNALSLW